MPPPKGWHTVSRVRSTDCVNSEIREIQMPNGFLHTHHPRRSDPPPQLGPPPPSTNETTPRTPWLSPELQPMPQRQPRHSGLPKPEPRYRRGPLTKLGPFGPKPIQRCPPWPTPMSISSRPTLLVTCGPKPGVRCLTTWNSISVPQDPLRNLMV